MGLLSLLIFPLNTVLVEWRGSGTRIEEIEIIVTPISKVINPRAKTIRFNDDDHLSWPAFLLLIIAKQFTDMYFLTYNYVPK